MRYSCAGLLGLALIACESDPSSPLDELEESSESTNTIIFRDVAAAVGLTFEHFLGATGEFYYPEIAGAGVALFDYDNDGDLDVYLLQGTLLGGDKQLSDTLYPPPQDHWPGNRLFRNELAGSGELRFTDVSERAGVAHQGYGMGAAVGDIDGDGDLDLYVTNFGSNVLYRNDGDGTFTDITTSSRTDDDRWTTSAAFIDYDRDGDVDLFLTNYLNFTLTDNRRCFTPSGRREYCGPLSFEPVPDRLFRNDGVNKFTDVTLAAGMGATFGSGLGVTAADFNDDGWQDIYVANDQRDNQLWINQRNGTFKDMALIAGAAVNVDGKAEASMGVTAGDIDGDGDEDLFMTHLATETNTLYLNDGSGNFVDATDRLNLGYNSFPFTGFGSEWFDYDNDGDLDLFVANGAVSMEASLVGKYSYPYQQTNQLFRNGGNLRFSDVSDRAGPAMGLLEVSRGAAFGDIDNDGDIDIVVSNNNGPVRLMLNEVGHRNHWLMVRLQGTESNRDGMGARVAVIRAGERPVWRRAHTDGSYLSANDIRVHFGLGKDTGLDGVAVRWPSGRTEIWRDCQADTEMTLVEGTGQPWDLTPEAGSPRS